MMITHNKVSRYALQVSDDANKHMTDKHGCSGWHA
jgi:hypothetical protein